MTPAAATTLAYTVAGTGPLPVVALHGLGADRRQPLAMFDGALLERCRIVAPDFRAHGETSLDQSAASLTIAQSAADVELLLDSLAVAAPVLLVGISLGAAVAAELLARRRVEVDRVVLIRPAWRWESRPPNLDPLVQIGNLLGKLGPERGRAQFVESSAYTAVRDVSPAAAAAMLDQFSATRARERADRLRTFPASAPHRPGRTARTFVVGNQQDPLHPFATAMAVAGDVGAELVELPPRYDAPADHASQLTSLLRSLVEDTHTVPSAKRC